VEATGLEGDFISRNAPGCMGCGVCQMGCPTGAKLSTDRSVVPKVLEKGGALLSCARVTSLVVEGGAAKGLTAVGMDPFTEEKRRAIAVKAKKVFLCAGAIGTPLVLLSQGLANGSGLVGENLHVHPAVGLAGLFDEVVDAWHGATQGYYAHMAGESAVLETFSATPDVYSVQYSAYARPIERLRHLATCGAMIGDTSSGRVRPGAGPGRSAMSYDVNDEDVRVMKKGLVTIAKAYFAAGAKEVLTAVPGASPVKSVAELEQQLGAGVGPDQLGVYASHPMATCRMGSDPKTSVVKPDGETHEVKDLVIADASVFPSSLGVNPQITVATTAMVVARAQLAKG
jgi:choline dehydrogenase-like flavoprotein